ncbi:MAG: protein kinase [Cyanobacteria bacterium]|nr:protein kinase [Cyanobacteriota bacterium]
MKLETDDEGPDDESKWGSHFYEPGARVGKYKVEHQIGAGGTGEIYKVKDSLLDKTFALKVLATDMRDDKALIRFQREAKTASKLSHPNIAKIYDFGLLEDGTLFMAMEFAEGESLAEILERVGFLSVEKTLNVSMQICEALSHSHSKAIIHRDIKPSNVMVCLEEDRIKEVLVLDFGIAKRMAITETGILSATTTGDIIGTPLYMSPEQSKGLTCGPQTDMYSLGCLIFQCLVGTPPFAADSAMETIRRHQNDLPPDLRTSERQPIPESLVIVVEKLLAKNPENRYESIDALLIQLKEIYDNLEIKSATSDSSLTPTKNHGSNRERRFRIAFTVALVLSIPLAVLLVCLLLPGHDSTPGVEGRPASSVIDSALRKHSRIVNLNNHKDLSYKSLARLNRSKLYELNLSRSNIQNGWLDSLKDSRIVILDLSNTSVSKVEFANSIGSLRRLNLSGTKVNRQSLSKLQNPYLRFLNIPRNGMTLNDVLKLVGRMPNLELIEADSPGFSESEIRTLETTFPITSFKKETGSMVTRMQGITKRLIEQERIDDAFNNALKIVSLIDEKYQAPPEDLALILHRVYKMGGKLGRKHESREAWRRSFVIAKNSIDPMIRSYATLLQAESLRHRKQFPEAVDEINYFLQARRSEYIEDSDEMIRTYEQITDFYDNSKNPGMALPFYEQLLKLTPKNSTARRADIMYKMARDAEKIGQLPQSRVLLQSIIDNNLRPDADSHTLGIVCQAYLLDGKVCIEQGQYAEALKLNRQVKELIRDNFPDLEAWRKAQESRIKRIMQTGRVPEGVDVISAPDR